jgi:alpha-glucosidase (family GH31 glycosyl hydrolase)
MSLIIRRLSVILLASCFICSCSVTTKNRTKIHLLSNVADTNVVLPPAWAFGIVYGAYTNQEQSVELIDKIIAHDYSIDGFWIDSWFWDWKNQGQGPKKFMDFVADTVSYPDMKGLWDFMEEKNIKAGIWMWDAIMKTGNEAEYKDFKSKGYFSKEKISTDGWHNGLRTTIIGDNSVPVKGTWYGDIDFKNTLATAYFQEKVKYFFDEGLDFIKLDKTDAIPVCKAMFETTQKLGKETKGRGFILSHSGGVDSPEYKRYPGKWTDDTRSDWTVEQPRHEFSPWLPRVAFKENLAMYTDTSRHFYKIPFLGNDMGGFSIGLDGKIDEELYIRWLEFALFVPLTTPFSQPENPTGNIAFNISPRADSLFRQYAYEKLELFPYIYSYAHLSRLEGKSIIRPTRLYEYLFGKEIFVAPVYEQGARKRKLYLPEGANWINYWTGETLEGGRFYTCKAPLIQIPLFIKQGAIIPKREYARSVEMGNNNLLELHIYDGASGRFTLIEDDGISNDYLKGIYATTDIEYKYMPEQYKIIIHPVEGYFEGMTEKRVWRIVLHGTDKIKNILFEGNSLNYTKNQSVIRFELPAVDKYSKTEITISK